MSNTGPTTFAKTYKSYANGYRALVENAFEKGPDFTDGIFYKDTTENYEDRIVEIGGIGDYAVWPDATRAKQSTIKEGYAQIFTQVPFGNEITIGRLFKKFQGRDVNIVRRAAVQLGNRAYRLTQRAPYSLFGYAFSDTNNYLTTITGNSVSALGPDGKRLASTVHPAGPENSDTWSNADASNTAVSEEGLDSLLSLLFNQIDDQGERKHYGNDGVEWLVPRAQFAKAKRIVTGELRAETGDNDLNSYNNSKTADGYWNGSQVTVRLVPFLDEFSTTAHHAVAKEVVEEEMPLVMLEAEKFYTDDYVEDSTKSVNVRGQLMFSVGFLSGRGTAHSQGTGTGTYSA